MKSKISDPQNWVDRYGDYLFRYALLHVRDPRLAEDLVQDTFLAALHSRESFTGKSKEKTWLTSIMRFKILDFYRRKQRQTAVSQTLDADDRFDDPFDRFGHWRKAMRPLSWEFDPAKLLERKEFWQTIEKCLAALPARTAAAFTLRELEGMESEAIAELLAISANNYWVLMHRARLRLRRCLEKRWFLQSLPLGSTRR